MTCFSVLTLLAAVVAPSHPALLTAFRWQTASAAPTVLALRSAVVKKTGSPLNAATLPSSIPVLFRLPLLIRPLPTSSPITQSVLLRCSWSSCASTAHTTSATRS
ncbi:hypothetical protein D6D25_09460 [Aureobasidium pullulans]|nr:hypothetical protein D6D25_09460 [Aureobasidium pullulans]